MFYANCDPNEPICNYLNQKNREYIQLIDVVHAGEFFDDDELAIHTTQVAAMLGTTRTQVERAFVIKCVLDSMPGLKSLCLELGHLDKQHLHAIAQPMFSVPEQFCPELERRIVEFLTPTEQHQALPSPRAISKRVRAWIEELNPKPADVEPDCQVTFRHEDNVTFLDGQFSSAIGHELHKIVATTAETHGISMGEALIQLLRGQITAKVVFHVYATGSDTNLDGNVQLSDLDAKRWRQRMTTQYRPTPELRAYIHGRDGTCRYPGCNVPAQKCDIDHVIPFPTGPTTPDNLHCLCRYHHNLKTERKIFPQLFADGRVLWTFPAGPLAQHQAA